MFYYKVSDFLKFRLKRQITNIVFNILKVRSNYVVRHFLSGRQDSNLQPQAPKACILTIEILPEVFVEMVGFEPTSSDFQSAALTIFTTFPLSAYLDLNQGLPS